MPLHLRPSIVSAILLLSAAASALTVSDLVVDSAVTWSLADSPVSVTGVVDVVGGGSLTIQAGVQVVFETAESKLLVSAGTLEVLGDETQPVSMEPSGTAWLGIEFGPSAPSATFGTASDGSPVFQGGSILQFVNMVRAGSSTQSAITSPGPVPFLNVVDCVDCLGQSGYPFYFTGLTSSLVMHDVSLSKEAEAYRPFGALYIRGVDRSSGSVIIERMETPLLGQFALNIATVGSLHLATSNLLGLVSLLAIDDLVCEDNYIETQTVSSSFTANQIGGVAFEILRNTFVNRPSSSSPAVSITNWRETSAFTVTGNLLRNGRLSLSTSITTITGAVLLAENEIRDSRSGGIYFLTRQSGPILIRDNRIVDCVSLSPTFPHISFTHQTSNAGSVEILRNEVVNAEAIDMIIQLNRGVETDANFVFSANVVRDSVANGPMIVLEDFAWTSFSQNIFDNVTSPTSVFFESSQYEPTETIALPGNYWGLFQDDIKDRRQTVGDILTTSQGPLIEFQTVLSGPSLDSPLEAVDFPFATDTKGGLVEANATVTLSGTTVLLVDLSYLVLGTLTLTPGLEAEILPLRSLFILGDDGVLESSGTAVAPIRLFGDGWQGIDLRTSQNTVYEHLTLEGCVIGTLRSGTGGLVARSLTIRDTSREGMKTVSPTTAPLEIYDSVFSDTGRTALEVNGHPTVILSRSSIVRSGVYGINVVNSVEDLSIVDCLFEETVDVAIRVFTNLESSHIISGNRVVGCGRGLSFIVGFRAELTLEGNVWDGALINRFSTPLFLQLFNSHNVSISDNIIANWTANEETMRIIYTASGVSGLSMDDNVFRNLQGQNILDLDYRTAGWSTNIRNRFEDDLTTSDPAIVLIRNWPTSGSTMQGNLFAVNLTSDFMVETREVASDVERIDMSRTFWNAQTDEDIEALLLDGRMEPSLSVIDFVPYLLTDDREGPLSSGESRVPSASPSGRPVSDVSSVPSAAPSFQPSESPSSSPSSFPSVSPSAVPSSVPSEMPSRMPSARPSQVPSLSPSSMPSTSPSHAPSSEPSESPSSTPTAEPSGAPSLSPSNDPTTSPGPTSPTGSPIPSQEPTASPSDEPSTTPSNQPSADPSSFPSLLPSRWPSAQPSMQPSESPTGSSLSPSREPSIDLQRVCVGVTTCEGGFKMRRPDARGFCRDECVLRSSYPTFIELGYECGACPLGLPFPEEWVPMVDEP